MTISATQIATQRSTAIEELARLLNDAQPVLGVVDFNVLDQLIEQLHEAYPAHWVTHNIAVNTINLPGVLEHFRARGLGATTTSVSELDIAQRSGFAPHELTHCAPANTWSMLRQIVDAGLNCSIDTFAELNRVDKLIDDHEDAQTHMGLVVTSQAPVDDDDPAQTHRGIGLRDHREEILQAYVERPWLNQLQLNFATPPDNLQQAAEHVAAVFQLAEDIEHAAGAQRVQRIYLAGGLPVNLASDDVSPSIDNHRFVHQAMVPELFDGKYTIVTNFTRTLTAKAGMLLARVEYSKDLDGRLIAVIHADAPISPAASYPVRIEAYDAEGAFKDDTELFYYDVVGPDGLVGQNIALPELEEGDVLAILDVGATMFGTHSTFSAPVYGIRADGLLTETSILHTGQTAQDLAQAAGVYQPAKVLH